MTTLWTPYCGPAPQPVELFARWNGDPVLLAALVAATAGGVFLLRDGQSRGCFLGGMFCLVVVFVSPLCALSSALFTARTLHHLLLLLVAAPLLALALPRLRTGHLGLAVAVQAVVFWAWHAPPLYGAALSHDSVYWVMQASLLASGVWFWVAIRSARAPMAIAGLLAAMLLMGLLGALIVFAGQSLYAPHALTTLAWGMTALEDQQAAGLIMWAPAAASYLAVALWRMNSLLKGADLPTAA
jgi:putative membrane protein